MAKLGAMSGGLSREASPRGVKLPVFLRRTGSQPVGR